MTLIEVSGEVEEISSVDYEAIFSKIVKSERGKVRKLTADLTHSGVVPVKIVCK